MDANYYAKANFTPETGHQRKIHSFMHIPQPPQRNFFHSQGRYPDFYPSPSLDDSDFSREVTDSSDSSSSDEDISDMANFDDIYQDMMEEEYGLEQIDGSPIKPRSQYMMEMPYHPDFEADEIIITESDISASQEYEHLNSHLNFRESENCNVSISSSPQISGMFYIDVKNFQKKQPNVGQKRVSPQFFNQNKENVQIPPISQNTSTFCENININDMFDYSRYKKVSKAAPPSTKDEPQHFDPKNKKILQELISQLQQKTQQLQKQQQKIEQLEQVIEQAVVDNQLLTLELNTFRIFSKDLAVELRKQKNENKYCSDQENIAILQERIKEIEKQNQMLSAQNSHVNWKFEMAIQVMQEQCKIDAQDQNEDIVEQLMNENQSLREIIGIGEMSYAQLSKDLRAQEVKLGLVIDDTSNNAINEPQHTVSDLASLISQASKEIKERKTKKKDESISPELQIKNIKPKKQFLLGGHDSDEEEEPKEAPIQIQETAEFKSIFPI